MRPTELEVKSHLEEQGWTVYKHGFPDLMLFKEGRLAFIEVKSLGDKLRPVQATVIEELKKVGIPCAVIYPDLMPCDYWTPDTPLRRRLPDNVRKARERERNTKYMRLRRARLKNETT